MEGLDREWREEELVPKDEVEEEEQWEQKDEVFANASLLSAIDVRDLIDVGLNWGKVFDLISWHVLVETDKEVAKGGPEEPCVVNNIVIAFAQVTSLIHD